MGAPSRGPAVPALPLAVRRLRPAFLALLLVAAGCGQRDWVEVPDSGGALKTSAQVRSERRLFDGAPPTIPHMDFGAACAACHDDRGIAVTGVGFAPPSPHKGTSEAGTTLRCRQCHVFVETDRLFVESDFAALAQNLRTGGRLYPGAPPTIPHKILMRENCVACHAGPAAREEIRTSHPERTRCRQCHVPLTTRETFTGGATPGGEDAKEP